jgi:uroporphyrinogen-III decarboxylase
MDTEEIYQQRLARYVTAMRNEKPDMIPIRPFVAEFTAKYAGYTCQEVAHDYTKAFDAAVKTTKDFGWDAVVPNMVYVWTGLAQAIGLRYYGIPGIHIPHTTGFNYIEPPEDQAWMRADEYDALIDDPTGFLYNIWLPRVSTEVSKPGSPREITPDNDLNVKEAPISRGEPSQYRNNLSFVKGGMAMLQYFYAFSPQIERLRKETGTVSAIAGIFKAPFDILADKLRGYVGLTMDMATQPKKVLAACEALMPHLCHVGLTTADPHKQVPIGFWMHRGCVPFVNPKTFDTHYWPTLKPIIEEFWKHGHQTLFYAEGQWHHHFDTFRELPDRSIVFHCDRDDIFHAHRKLHDKFALSGGVPNVLLSFGKAEEVRDFCRRVIREVASDGGYIMDAGAIMQDDTSVENMRVLTEVTRQEGAYARGSFSPPSATPPCEVSLSVEARQELAGMTGRPAPRIQPGVCFSWDEKAKELPEITGDKDLVRKVWNDIEGLAHTYIWQVLLSF